MTNDKDGRPAFILYCRQPHTRINYIMEMIDAGWDDKMLAMAFDMEEETAAVYRKAHDGKLSRGMVEDPRRGECYEMVMAGYSASAIAKALHLHKTTVYQWAKEYRPFRGR